MWFWLCWKLWVNKEIQKVRVLGVGYRDWAISIYKNLLNKRINIKILKKKNISLREIRKYNPDFILFYGLSEKVNKIIVQKFKL